jgi:hypothetical protein
MAQDMAGDGVLARDWVYDGQRVWEVMAITAAGTLRCRDPYALAADQHPQDLDPAGVAKVRADRSDDPRYLRAVFEQAAVLRDFWADER